MTYFSFGQNNNLANSNKIDEITKSADSFLVVLSKNVSGLKLLPLPSGITAGTLMDELINLDGVPEYIKQYLRDVKSGNLGKYSASEIIGLNASITRATQEASGGMTAAQKKAAGELVTQLDDVADEVAEAEIKITGSKRKTSSWDPTVDAEDIDFEDVSDEFGFDAGTAGREADSLINEKSDSGTKYTPAEKIKYDELSSKSDVEIKKLLKDLVDFRKQNKTGEITSDGAMVLDIARDRNLITEDDYLKILTP